LTPVMAVSLKAKLKEKLKLKENRKERIL